MKYQYKLSAYAISHIGKRRDNHEDNLFLDDNQFISEEEQKKIRISPEEGSQYIEKIYSSNIGTSFIFAVSDGMGGHSAGEVAGRIVVEQLVDMKDRIFMETDLNSSINELQEYIKKANSSIVVKSKQNIELKGMGATLTGILITKYGIVSFNIGDSRTYCFKDGIMTQITTDHTKAQQLLSNDLTSKEEINLNSSKNVLTRYLGIDKKFFVPRAEISETIDISDKTWFLLCSDGLTDVLQDKKIENILSSHYEENNISSAVKNLIEKSLEGESKNAGGRDNITVVLVSVEKYKLSIKERICSKIKTWF